MTRYRLIKSRIEHFSITKQLEEKGYTCAHDSHIGQIWEKGSGQDYQKFVLQFKF